MKIVKLTAENVKRLRAVEITPDGNTVVIAGKNGQGKTSVLDAIWFALGGGAAVRGTSKPIRDGQSKAQVTLDLGELKVTRTWRDGDKSTLRVESADGAQYKSPQAMLDSLVGRLSFDPLAFAQQDERTQLASLLELVELPFDPDTIAGQRARLYEQRTDVGRTGKQLEGHLAGMADPGEDVPDEEISVAAVANDYRTASALHHDHARKADLVREFDLRIAQRTDRIKSLEEQLQEQRATLTEEHDRVAEARATLDELNAALPDLDMIQQRLDTAERTNTAVRAKQERARVAADLADHKAKYDGLTGAIAALDEAKAHAIAQASMPIDGLAFNDAGVTYRGVPFKQCSAAEQLRVSLAMAMAMNPKIRVVRITDGSLLDSDNMRLIEQMAVDQDYQVWIERVDDSGAVGVVIEDGAVATPSPVAES